MKIRKTRFRKVKQGKITRPDDIASSQKETVFYAAPATRLKAILTDSFMLLMPIMYFVFYVVMGSREAFAAHRAEGWLWIVLPLVIVETVFMAISGQTPGMRHYGLDVVDTKNATRPAWWRLLLRNLLGLVSFATTIGWVMMFFRKDGAMLHDLLSGTRIVTKR